MLAHRDDPIVAIATPPGRGGIGVVRLSFGRWSGTTRVARFTATLTGRGEALVPRYATMVAVRSGEGAAIDRGIALLFVGPHSYTGDDVLELQLHGGPSVLAMVVARCLAVAEAVADDEARMRPAAPGEFTERAFLNDKLDLAQAEAVADLIEASSEAAVLGAQASLAGAFSAAVRALVDGVIELRALVEATLDFPDEEIDFLEASDARGRLAAIRAALDDLFARAERGARLREGLVVVLAGRPNVGKSSLLNALAEDDVAIVTPVAGTTRDRVEQDVRIGGLTMRVIDTAGIRSLDEADVVERIGIERTWQAVAGAQVVLHVVEAGDAVVERSAADLAIAARLPGHAARRTIVNKIDLVGDDARSDGETIRVSAKTGAGIALLRDELVAIAGGRPVAETSFTARTRHVEALRAAQRHLAEAAVRAAAGDRQLDLMAEELRLAQAALDGITGTFTPDDLLGEIFGRFCIGK
jgi:tRNA modification GTPase